MTFPIPSGRITAPFTQPRPLNATSTHIHGAIDVSGGTLQAIAPVSGTAQLLQFLRPNLDSSFLPSDKPTILALLPRHYYYDLYGGLLTIHDPQTDSLHILTHFWASSMWTRKPPFYLESSAKVRFPCIALFSEPFTVKEGEHLLPVGNAGFSTGAHIHWEIHPNSRKGLSSYADRLDPASFFPKEDLHD